MPKRAAVPIAIEDLERKVAAVDAALAHALDAVALITAARFGDLPAAAAAAVDVDALMRDASAVTSAPELDDLAPHLVELTDEEREALQPVPLEVRAAIKTMLQALADLGPEEFARLDDGQSGRTYEDLLVQLDNIRRAELMEVLQQRLESLRAGLRLLAEGEMEEAKKLLAEGLARRVAN
jgi:hypothetical protein